ncbi:MAG TPA: hypothetical protein VJG30_03375 [Candidatus Nanoarchaeia archaeon]|nr:hypothetical protein [Candidatus Nanoarchaeia archaeon]
MKLVAVLIIVLILLAVAGCSKDVGRTGATVVEKDEAVTSVCDGVEVCVGDDCKVEDQKDCS